MSSKDGFRKFNASLALQLVVLSLLPAPSAAQADTQPPAIHVTHQGAELVDGAVFRTAVTPAIAVTDASTVTVEALLDGAVYTQGTPVTAEGTHQLAVAATDAAGNEAELTVSFAIDLTSPSFVDVQPPKDSLVGAGQVTLTGTVTDAVVLLVDGAAVPLAGNSFSAGPFPLAEGARTWTLEARDAAGNSSQWQHRLVRDATPPAVALSQPSDGALLTSASTVVTGTASDTNLAEVKVNGVAATISGGGFQATQVPLSEGLNELVAEATDRAGNVARATRTVTLDTQAPTLAINDPAPGTLVPDDAITVSGTVSDAHLDRLEVNGYRATITGASWSVRVPLEQGVNTLVAQATDRLGLRGEARVSILRDSSAPEVRITQPAEGSYWKTATVDVAGTVSTEDGLTLTVNGQSVVPSAGAFTASVALVEGENRIIARATDAVGNQGAHTRIVYRDNTAPTLVSSEPASGALAIDPATTFRLVFAEPLAPVTSGWSLTTAAGAPIAAVATLDGEVLTLRPAADLPAQTGIRLTLGAGLADRAGNAFGNPQTLEFTTADTAAPGAPTLDPVASSYLCASRITLAGAAEAGSRIAVNGGAAGAQAVAGSDGRFTLQVDLLPDAVNRLEVTATDNRGNRSAPAVAQVVQDCRAPSVLTATLDGTTFTIRFSEPIAAATLSQGVSVRGSSGPLAGTTSLSADAATASLQLSAAPPAGPVRLEVSQLVRDRAGNALVFPFSRIFNGAAEASFLGGRAIDQATGRPLQGALAMVITSDGAEVPAPQPQQLTAGEGRFQVPVPAGTHYLLVTRPGYTPVMRLVVATAGQGADVFDPRLTPAAPSRPVGSTGHVEGTGGLRLDVPPGSLTGGSGISLTALEEQGLPALLPFGWSPQGAAWVGLESGSFSTPATLRLPVTAPNGTTLTLARLDLATLQWIALGTDTVIGGAVEVPVASASGYVALLPDEDETAPPAAVAGNPLGSAAAPLAAAVTAASIGFDPEVVLPSQRSQATVGFTTTSAVPSGLPLTLTIKEQLTLVGGAVRREPPYEADLVLYHSAEGAPRARFGLMPSVAAQSSPLTLGVEDVTVAHYAGGTLQGNVIGPSGGAVGTAEGDRIELPAGALDEPTAVSLQRLDAEALPGPVPAGSALLGVLSLDLGGQVLAQPATLSFHSDEAPAAGQRGLVLEVIPLGAGEAYRPVASLVPGPSGWVSAPIDPSDLPWPGVRRGGRYALVRLLSPVGYYRGRVFGTDGAVLPGAVVRSAAVGWIQRADEIGRYVLPAPVGAATLVAQDPTRGDSGQANGTIAQADQRVDLDLQLARTGPRVVTVTPAAGAVDVIPGIQPTIRFSEPVAAASLAGGIRLLEGGSHEVAIDCEVQGDLVTVVPRATLRPGTAFELRIGAGVRDLQGYQLAEPVVSSFTTRGVVASDGVRLSRIHIVEPNAAGRARIIGKPGAIPSDAAAFAENTSRLASTVTVEAAADGSFELEVEAGRKDTVLLHVLLTGANEVILELTPFLTADLRTAFVDENEVRFTTGDGIEVLVPAGAFDGPAAVTLVPRTPAQVPVALPQQFVPVTGFELSFGGGTAPKKALQIAVPAPAGSVNGSYILASMVNVFGERRWMMQDLVRLAGGFLTTEEPATANARSLKVDGPRSIAEAATRRPKSYLPGTALPGMYMVAYSPEPLRFFAMPLVAGFEAAIEMSPLGMVAIINQTIERLLGYGAILLPGLQSMRADITIRDLTTGYRLFQGTFDPPASDGEVVILPNDNYGDTKPPYPVGGGPLRFFVVHAQPGTRLDLGQGITAQASASQLTVSGAAGSADEDIEVVLLGLDDGASNSAASSAEGSFSISVPAVAGRRYLLAVSALVSVQEPLEIAFSESIQSLASGIDVFDPALIDPEHPESTPPYPVTLAPVGTWERVRVRPVRGWVAGKTYQLHIGNGLRDPAGNMWLRTLSLSFKVAKSTILSGFELERVRDVARLGSLLFVAAENQGLVVLDASNPGKLVSFVPSHPVDGSGNIALEFPLRDVVRGVAVDPHGRVLVAGGGVTSPGQLKLLDAMEINPITIASDPSHRDGWGLKGGTIVSNQMGTDSGFPHLLEGAPRRLSVLSHDQKSHWLAGQSAPDGLIVSPDTPPAAGGLFDLSVSGLGGVSGAPVTLRNLDRGTFKRVDATVGGAFAVTLQVEAGDRLELLRNVESYAYVTVQGAGIAVVDVNHFATIQDDIGSSVLTYYTGYDKGLELCQEPVSDISTALLDLDTMYDRDKTGHELSLLGLIGFRGLLMLTSSAQGGLDPRRIEFAGEACANQAGTNNVVSLEVLQNVPILPTPDRPSNAANGDWALVTHRQAGLLIYNISDRTSIVLAARIPLPAQPSHVSVDVDRRLAYVSTYSGQLLVVDLASAPKVDLVDLDGNGRDDRVLEEIPLAGITNTPLLLVPELGVAFAGGVIVPSAPPPPGTQTPGGATSIAIGGPRVAAVTRYRGTDGLWHRREVTRLAPFGVPRKGNSDPADVLRGTFQVYTALPGWLGREITLDVESIGPGGQPIAGAGEVQDLPRAAFTGAQGLKLRRLSNDKRHEGFNLYRSEEVVAVADLRAAREYHRSPKEDEEKVCRRCKYADEDVDPAARELLSGDAVRVRLPDALRAQLLGSGPTHVGRNYSPSQLEGATVEVASVRWELSPSLRQEPTLNPSFGTGDVPGTLLHSGETTLAATDLFVKGRGIDFAFTRTYRNQTVGAGPLGPGWDFGYHQRLRELPNGDVEYYDGRGRLETFKRTRDNPIEYDAPAGRFVYLTRNSTGWVLITQQVGLMRFDRFGRLTLVSDPNKDKPSDDVGTELVFSYDAHSRLAQVEANNKRFTFEYDAQGRLESLKDHTDREVRYTYDSSGRLATVRSPKVNAGDRPYPLGLTTTYQYAAQTGDLRNALGSRDNLTSVTDARNQQWLSVAYTDVDNDGLADEATHQVWGGDAVDIAYDFEAKTAAVTDRRRVKRTYTHDAGGHATSIEVPTGQGVATAHLEYDEAEGLLRSSQLPQGLKTTYSYFSPAGQPAESRRRRAVVEKVAVTPGGGEANRSITSLDTSYSNLHPWNQAPQQVVTPQGGVTKMERNNLGIVQEVVRGVGNENPDKHFIVRDSFGQPERLLRNGHETEFGYSNTGARKGYLERVETKMAADAQPLVTRFEVDERGNVTRAIDPRNVTNEFVYNELDQLVEERLATTGPSGDGAHPGALSYVNRYLYDANGNLEEARLAYGTDGRYTRTVYVYGPLNELTEVRREIAPSGEWAIERYTYDENRNLEERIGPDQQTVRFEYDQRNLVVAMTRGFGTPEASVERYEYDTDGRQTARFIDDPQVENATEPRWKTEYDGFGRVKKTIDPLGNSTTTSYPDNGKKVVVEHWDANQVLLAKQEVEYDEAGRPLHERRFRLEPGNAGPSEPLVVTKHYDFASNLIGISTPGPQPESITFTFFLYDAAERLKAIHDRLGNRTEYDLDAAGNRIRTRTIEQRPDGEVTTSEEARFDALGRMTERSGPFGTWKGSYDARGNLIREEQPEVATPTTYSYDGLDRQVGIQQPNGVSLTYGYDNSSRLKSYKDALSQETTWGYDALDRTTRVTYADGKFASFAYDRADNLIREQRLDGLVLTNRYDAASRLTEVYVQRPGEPEPAVPAQRYVYDGLNRTTEAGSGSIVSRFRHDSLGQLLREETAGVGIEYSYDRAGNLELTRYPGGSAAFRTADAINRLASISFGTTPEQAKQKVEYGYQGPSLIATLGLGSVAGGGAPALSGSFSYDAGRRPEQVTFRSGDRVPFAETLSWYPRNTKKASARGDLNGTGISWGYDDAGRLTTAQRSSGLPAGAPVARSVAGLPDSYGFQYDGAQNMLRINVEEGCQTVGVELPLDASRRNRVAAVDGAALAWDANGNLTRKGNRYFHYDYRDRLIKVTAGPNPATDPLIASYEYDDMGRRLSKTLADGTRVSTRWAGWQPIEQYRNDSLVSRRVYGLAIDEIVSLELDVTGDGVLSASEEFLPIYDSTHSLAAVARPDGKVVERYEYSPYGERLVVVNDFTAPHVEQVRWRNGEIWIETSEESLLAEVRSALRLRNETSGRPISFEVTQPVLTGPEAGRRLVVRITDSPGEESWPDAGEIVSLDLPGTALVDTFANRGQLANGWAQTFTWRAPGSDAVLMDVAAPRLDQVCLTGGRLVLTFSEEPSASGLEQISLDDEELGAAVEGDRYTVRSVAAVEEGEHELRIGTGPLDLSGKGLVEEETESFALAAGETRKPIRVARVAGLVEESTIGNQIGFQGLERDAETGFLYVRHRYYDPEMGRFVTTDPLGYVDSPNLYAFVGWQPNMATDPMGTCVGSFQGSGFCQGIAEGMRKFGQGTPESEIEADRREVYLEHKLAFIAKNGRRPRGDDVLYEGLNGGRLYGSGQWVNTTGQIEPDHAELALVGGVAAPLRAWFAARAVGGSMLKAGGSALLSVGDELVGAAAGINPSTVTRLRFFHGTSHPAESFANGFDLEAGGGQLGRGLYLTADREIAENFARYGNPGGSNPKLLSVEFTPDELAGLSILDLTRRDPVYNELATSFARGYTDVPPHLRYLYDYDAIRSPIAGWVVGMQIKFNPRAQSFFQGRPITLEDL